MSEKAITKKEVTLLENKICPVDGLKIDGMYIVRKGRSRYLRVLHKIDGKSTQHTVGRIDDKKVLAALVKDENFARMIRKVVKNFNENSWIQVLNVLEDYLTIADRKTKRRVKKKLVEILEKMQWGEL